MTRILLFGTFDMIHKGHEDLLKQVRELADDSYVVVSIARDENVLRVKGRPAKNNERERVKIVVDSGMADEVVLGALQDYIGHIREVGPDIVALGYDQVAYTDGLEGKMRDAGIQAKIVRLLGFMPEVYSTTRLLRGVRG